MPSRSLELHLEQHVDSDLDFGQSKPLESLELGDIGLCRLSYQAEPDQHHESGAQTPSDADQLVSHQLQSWCTPAINRWRVLSCCLVYFGNGLNDSAPGALIPSIEAHYAIGYAVVSLIFVSQAIGFVSAAFFTNAIKTRLGQARTYALSELLMVASYAVVVASPPYPVVVVVFFFVGWAMAMNLALSNVFCANLAQSTVILGAAHGSYGIGGTIGPLMATAMVSRGIGWSRYYLITLAVCLAGGLASVWSFRGIEDEPQTSLPERVTQQAGSTSKRSLLVEALKNPVTIISALFTFAYQGAEVSISGWVISFLITVRQGDPSKVGYVTAGFWVRPSSPPARQSI
jgi:fucose permease